MRAGSYEFESCHLDNKLGSLFYRGFFVFRLSYAIFEKNIILPTDFLFIRNFYLNNHSLNERYKVFDQTRELSSNIIVDLQSIYNLSNKVFMGTGEGLGLISINSDTVLVDMVINDNLVRQSI